ncbi:MAG: hypothetical protein SF182_07485 [Deltaproteobacteria bacterium]|nr:hypothetical protein [Deltaproteobacteria bacterium]
MKQRVAIVLSLAFAVGAHAQDGFTVSTCFSEFPGHSCSPVELGYQHGVTLEGPVPGTRTYEREIVPAAFYYYKFHGILPGNYILRASGCNPFGCWLDTPITVVDRDVEVPVRQISDRTPTPLASPTEAGNVTPPCVGDGNRDDVVTIDELVEAVGNALSGCPSQPAPTPTGAAIHGIDLFPSDATGIGEYQSGCRGPLAYLSVCIANAGDVTSGPFAVLVNPGSDQFEIDDLSGGAQRCFVRPFNNWQAEGYHEFQVVVDGAGAVDETDEVNNSQQFSVLRPTIPATCTSTPAATPTP